MGTETGPYPNPQFLIPLSSLTTKALLVLLALQSQPGYSRQTGAQLSVTELGLAGMELTLPTAALPVLCFVFEARMVLTTHQRFGYC